MKNITLTIVALVAMSWGASAQSEEITWPIEPKNEYAELMLEYYNLNYEIMGDRTEIDEEFVDVSADILEQDAETIKSELVKLYGDMETMWRKFVWLTNEDRIEEAMDFYSENRLMIDCVISNSEVRYHFHDQVIGNMANSVMNADELSAFMLELIEFDEIMLTALYQSTEREDVLSTIMDIHDTLDTLYYNLGRYDDMLTLWDRTCEVMDVDEVYKLYMSAEIYTLKDDYDTAKRLLLEAKDILTQRIEDGIDVERSESALSQVIETYEAL
jgi:tetratricopeptide (TPR) repeat protein